MGGTAVIGIADYVQSSLLPEVHAHDQQRREPLATVEVFTMTGTLAGYAVAVQLRRRSFGRAHLRGP